MVQLEGLSTRPISNAAAPSMMVIIAKDSSERFHILKCNQEVTSGFSEHSKNFNKEPELLWPLVEICG